MWVVSQVGHPALPLPSHQVTPTCPEGVCHLSFPDLKQPSTKVSFGGGGRLGVPLARWFYTHLSDPAAKADPPTPWGQRPPRPGHGFSHGELARKSHSINWKEGKGGASRKHLGAGWRGRN